jgi:hypothetical protein
MHNKEINKIKEKLNSSSISDEAKKSIKEKVKVLKGNKTINK